MYSTQEISCLLSSGGRLSRQVAHPPSKLAFLYVAYIWCKYFWKWCNRMRKGGKTAIFAHSHSLWSTNSEGVQQCKRGETLHHQENISIIIWKGGVKLSPWKTSCLWFSSAWDKKSKCSLRRVRAERVQSYTIREICLFSPGGGNFNFSPSLKCW